jgi:hypothetical protein
MRAGARNTYEYPSPQMGQNLVAQTQEWTEASFTAKKGVGRCAEKCKMARNLNNNSLGLTGFVI